ncbi:MAG: diguanylate cyclase, partial [Sphingobacteriales bacterium]
MQKKLLKTRALQSAIFNSAYFSSIATDENGVIQIFNVGAECMLGYLAKDVVDRITPVDFSDPRELLARAAELSAELKTPITAGFDALVFKARRGIEDIYEMTYVRKDASRFPVVVSVTALRDILDTVIGYLLISTDNTARKSIELALEAKNLELRARTADLQRFRTAMDATADAITLVSRETMLFIEANAAASKLLGYSKEELLRMGPVEIGSGSLMDIETEYDAIIANQSVMENKQALLQCKDGTEVHVEMQRQAQRSEGEWIIVCAMRDISERQLAEEQMYRLAYYDALTSLPNRTLFYETLKKTVEQASSAGWMVAVLFIDMDHFKVVNDTLGHAAGDELLRQFSSRLVACSRIRDTVGRLGGDEFALILVMQDGRQTAANVALKIKTALKAPFTVKSHVLTITASIGITVCPDDSTDPQTLLKFADTAMYKAKQAGRATFRFFTPQMNADALARLALEVALRQAVESSEFLLF